MQSQQGFLDTSFSSNKGLKFEYYTNRKFNTNNKYGPNILTYIEPTKYMFKNFSIRVRKKKRDNMNDLGKNNIPASNQYYPKFNYVQPPIKNGKVTQ